MDCKDRALAIRQSWFETTSSFGKISQGIQSEYSEFRVFSSRQTGKLFKLD
jgi:hypothetical protein